MSSKAITSLLREYLLDSWTSHQTGMPRRKIGIFLINLSFRPQIRRSHLDDSVPGDEDQIGIGTAWKPWCQPFSLCILRGGGTRVERTTCHQRDILCPPEWCSTRRRLAALARRTASLRWAAVPGGICGTICADRSTGPTLQE